MKTAALAPEQTTEEPEKRDLGPWLHDRGVTYRVWALGRKKITAHIESATGEKRTLELQPGEEAGYFAATDPAGKAGDLYKYSVDGGAPIPDFLSHFQPEGVLGPSMIVDANVFAWQAKDWRRPAWDGQVVYECHIGTFTKEGTYRSAIERLDFLCGLGITALEIMPVAEFAGRWGWGYDGVMLFAPTHNYGTPDDFRALIDACHLRGLAVILDVVFNHLGPEGNFSHQYSDYFFHLGKDNPWGQNFNLDGENAQPVRAMLLENIRYWLDEFRIDGFRMDATHAVFDPSPVHLLAEAADIVHQHGGFIIAEDERNARQILEPRTKPGAWGFDAAWADDFHHVMRVSQTGEQHYYYSMVKGTADEVAQTLEQGWLFCGQISLFHKRSRGTPCSDLPPQAFVYCISNHDQVGNRLLGDRFHHDINPAAYRALSLFLCLVPYTPMLFMGQEWAASTPFLYFTDMPDELGKLIAEGRKREFLATETVRHPTQLEEMVHPQAEETFLRSKLDWSEVEKEEHRRVLDLYRAGLKLRSELFGRHNPPRDCWRVEAQNDGLTLHYDLGQRSASVYLHFKGEKRKIDPAKTVLIRSNSPQFAGEASDENAPETIVVAEPPKR